MLNPRHDDEVLFGMFICFIGAIVLTTLFGCAQGPSGVTGPQGAQGNDGANGHDGSSCSATAVLPGPVAPNGGAIVSCTDGTSALVVNGATGATGQAGAAAPATIGITKVIKPCPQLAGSYPEVFFVLSDRTLVASFSENANGKNTRLSPLTPGSYATTDGRGCSVTVTEDSVSWSGGSASY